MGILQKWLPGILAFLIVSVLSLQFAFYFFGDSILKKSLSAAFDQYIVHTYPDAERLPVLNFETLRINLLSGNVVISNIEYHVTLPLEKGNAVESIALFIPEVALKEINLWKLYWHKVLNVNSIKLHTPLIRMIQVAKPTEDATGHDEKNNSKSIIRQVFNDRVHAITFKKLHVEDAHLEYSLIAEPVLPADITNIAPQHIVENLSLEISDIHLDSTVFSGTADQHFAKDVMIKLKNYHAILPDSSYRIGVDSLNYSSADEKLVLKNVSFLPENVSRIKSRQEEYFSIHVPDIELSEISLLKILADKVLILDEFIIRQPAIYLYGNFDRKNMDRISDLGLRKFSADSLYSNIKEHLNFLSVNAFKLQHGSLQVHNIKDKKEVLLSVKRLNLNFDDFSLHHKQPQKDAVSMLPAAHIMMNLREVRMTAPDKMHTISSKAVLIEADAGKGDYCNMIIDSVHVAPITDSLSGFFALSELPIDLGYDIAIDKVAFWSLNLDELARHKVINADSLLLTKPETTVANFSRVPFGELASQDPAADTTGHKSLKEILYDWSHARLNFHPVIAPGRPTALFYGINIDTIQIDSSQFYFYKANYSKSVLEQVGSLKNLDAGFQQVSIGHRRDDKKLLQFTEDHKVAVYARNFNLHAHQGILHLPNDSGPTSGGTLRFNEAYFSTVDAEGFVNRLYIWPDRKNTAASRNRLSRLFIPYAKVAGINFERLYKDQYADIQYLQIIRPEIEISIDEQQTTISKISLDLSVRHLYQWIAPYLNNVSLQNLAIENANLTVKKKNIYDPVFYDFFRIQSVDLALKDFYIDAATNISLTRPLYARDLSVHAKNFALNIVKEPSDSPVTIYGKTAEFSSDDARLNINDVSLQVAETDERNNFQADIQSVSIKFDNLYDYFMHNSLKLHQVEAFVPALMLKRHSETSLVSNTASLKSMQKLQPDIYPYVDGLAEELVINHLNIHQGSFAFSSYAEGANAYLLADTIHVQASDILIDEYARSENRLGYAKEVDFYIHIDKGLLHSDSTSGWQISNAKISSDDSQFKAEVLQYAPILGENLMSRGVPRFNTGLVVDGIDYRQAFSEGNVNLNKVTFSHPDIALRIDQNQAYGLPDTGAFGGVIGALVNNVHIKQVSAEDGRLTLYGEEDTVAMQHINAQVYDVAVNPDILEQTINTDLHSANVTRKLLFADNMMLEVNNYHQENSLSSIEAEKVMLSTKSAQMKVLGLHYKPKHEKSKLELHYPYQKTWADVRIPEITIQDIDIYSLIYDDVLKIGRATAVSPHVALFKDKSLDIDSLAIKPMPQDLLRQVKFPFSIDSVIVTNGFISYEEKVPNVEQTGKITFEKFNAKATGAASDTSVYDKNKFLNIRANAYLLGKAPLNVDLNFHLQSPRKLFSAVGKMGEIDLSYLNVVLEPVASVHVNTGLLHQMDFQFVGDQYASSGMMHCYYSNLHLMLIDRRTRAFGLDEKVGSFLANTFVIRADNPTNKAFRIGKISYERDATRSMLHYLWKSVLSGIKSSVGLVKKADKTKNFSDQER